MKEILMTTENNEKIIALDIGGVCLELHHDLTFKYFGIKPDDLTPEFITTSGMYQCGQIDTEKFVQNVGKMLNNGMSDNEILHGWNLIIGDEIDGMPELLQELTDAGYRLVFFSNTCESHILDMYRRLPFTRFVSGAIYSYEVGTMKPDNAIYGAFERTHGKPCLYIDDLQENIDAGLNYGWNSIRFTGVDNLREEIEHILP